MVVSPKDPPGSFSCLGIAAMPERTLRGVRVWCWPRVPIEAMGWTVGTRGILQLSQAPRSADPRPEKAVTSPGWLGTDSFGDSAAQAGYKGWAGEPPVVNHQPAVAVGSWRLGWLAVAVGHAQQDLQLLGAAPGGQDLCGGFQPAQHDHGQGRSGRIVGIDRGADARRLRPDQLWPSL